ncbi:hypothetical protein BHE74_00015544 [Ensete ventricosum]|nr:hypothetical protein BHE74_00015544 [Ensete ventricosum]
MNASSNFLHSSGSIDGQGQAPRINKVQPLTVTNRKRLIPNESSSPSVTQWVGQRPQKISRTRRVNVVSPVSNLDEAQFLHEGSATPDVGARMAVVDSGGLLITRGLPNNIHQSKQKFDNVLSPSVLSESDDSAAVEIKFKEKGIDNFELEDGPQTSLKATSVFPTKKNKTPPKEEIGDGVRRQGRSGRRESDDDREELLAAANAARNASCGYLNIQNYVYGYEPLVENSAVLSTDNGSLSGYKKNSLNQLHPDLAEGEDGEVGKVISELKMRLYQQVICLEYDRKLEQLAVNKLVEMACKRLMLEVDLWFIGGRGSSSHKSGTTKVSKQLALAFAASATWLSGVTSITSVRHGLGNKTDQSPLDPYQSSPQMGEQSVTRRKKEVLLDDVTGSARAISSPTHSLSNSAKWKRTERDRDQNKDALGRSSTAKVGRPSSSGGRGERKTKTKPKQKIAQLSTSGNGLGRVTEAANLMSPALTAPFDTVNSSITKIDQEVELHSLDNMVHDSSKENEDAIFTNLPLHGIESIDELDVAEGLGGQGQDIATWLNVDEDSLQDHDLVGLEIPMDDLSELTLNF